MLVVLAIFIVIAVNNGESATVEFVLVGLFHCEINCFGKIHSGYIVKVQGAKKVVVASGCPIFKQTTRCCVLTVFQYVLKSGWCKAVFGLGWLDAIAVGIRVLFWQGFTYVSNAELVVALYGAVAFWYA